VAGGVMQAEIRLFDIKKLPYTARFGLGSTEPIKRWATFTLEKTGDLYYILAIDLRKDKDSSWIHTSVHQSGEIRSSRYTGRGEEQKKYYSGKVGNIGDTFQNIANPYEVIHGEEYLEPGYLYSGLLTLEKKHKKINDHNEFIPCQDGLLANSRLHSSLDLVPWTGKDEIKHYLINKQNRIFDDKDPRCHVFIFRWGNVTAVVSMRFTDGNSPLDIQKVVEADKNAKPLKRLFHHEKINLSESASLKANPAKRL
jgi:hypothetical protein